LERPVHAVMSRRPKCIGKSELAAKAVQVMEQHAITSLLIVDSAIGSRGSSISTTCCGRASSKQESRWAGGLES